MTRERWGAVVCAAMLFVAGFVYLSTPRVQLPGNSDGHYSWLFARSLAFDGDIDFKNDYALCGDPMQIGWERGTGHPDNLFYPGPALFWAPVLLVMRAVLGSRGPAPGCAAPWSSVALALSPIAGALLALVCHRVARRLCADGVAALATALITLGGPALLFASMVPSYSHIYDALCSALVVLCALRAGERPERLGRWALCALALSACVFQRLSNLAWLAVPVSSAWCALRHDRRALGRAFLVLCAGEVLGAAPFFCIYAYLYGNPLTFTHGRYFLQPLQAHPFLLLFEPAGGLLFRTPSVWLALLGLPLLARQRATRPVFLPLALIALFELWLSSAAIEWQSSRRLLNLSVLFVLSAAAALEVARRLLEVQPHRALSATGLLLACGFVVPTAGIAFGGPRDKVPLFEPARQEGLYGAAFASFFSAIDQTFGDLSIWPAEAWFRLRYGLPGTRFGLATLRRYTRSPFTLAWGARDLRFAEPAIRELMTRVRPTPGGVNPLGARSSVVFCAQWPFASQIVVRARALGHPRLRVGLGRALGSPLWLGAGVNVDSKTSRAYEFEVPRGTFGSGLAELVFETDAQPTDALVLEGVRIDDREPRPPAF